jgi:hypothetical protein
MFLVAVSAVLFSMAFANSPIVITPIPSYNPSTNTLTFTYSVTNYTLGNQYNATNGTLIVINAVQLNNVTEHSSTNLNSLYGYINIEKQSINRCSNFTITPTFLEQNISFNCYMNKLHIAPEAKWNYNSIIMPEFNKSFSIVNSSLNFSVMVNKIGKINKRYNISNDVYYNSTLNLTINTQYPKINKVIDVGFNQSYKNTTLNLTLTSPSFSELKNTVVNYTDLYLWYNSTYNVNCNSSITVNSGNSLNSWHICTQTKGANSINIGLICAGYDIESGNITTLASCVSGLYSIEIKNATDWHQNFTNEEHQLTLANAQNMNYSRQLQDNSQFINSFEGIIAEFMIGGSIAIFVALYLKYRRKNKIRIG